MIEYLENQDNQLKTKPLEIRKHIKLANCEINIQKPKVSIQTNGKYNERKGFMHIGNKWIKISRKKCNKTNLTTIFKCSCRTKT